MLNITKPLKRKGFALSVVIIACIFTFIGWLRMEFTPKEDLLLYVGVKSTVSFLCLLTLTPFIIRRLIDMGGNPLWIIPFWVTYSLSLDNIILLEKVAGVLINPFSWPLTIFNVCVLILGLFLFFFPSIEREGPNKKIQPTACRGRCFKALCVNQIKQSI